MFTVTITEKGGDQKRLDFDKAEITIGRVQGNDIVLPKGNVSKRHSRIVLKDGKFIIVDLKSTNGTYVNGRKIASPLVLKGTDKIYIGDFILAVEGGEPAAADEPAVDEDEPMAPPPPPRPPAAPTGATLDSDDEDAPEPAELLDSGLVEAAEESEESEEEELEEAPAKRAPPPLATPLPPIRPPSQPLIPVASAPPARRPVPTPAVVEAAGGDSPAASAARPVAARAPVAPVRAASSAPVATMARPSSEPVASPVAAAGAAAAASRSSPAGARAISEARRAAFDRLAAELSLATLGPGELADPELRKRAEKILSEAHVQGAEASVVLREALGLGPLEELVGGADVTQIQVTRSDRIVAWRGRSSEEPREVFTSDASLALAVRRLLARSGRPFEPLVDALLSDGWRLSAALPPVAVRGATCTLVREGRPAPLQTLADLARQGALPPQAADWLSQAVSLGRTLAVSGRSADRVTVLAALAGALPPDARVVSIEEVPELRLPHDRWLALDASARGERDLGRLAALASRFRPDRLIVGPLRSGDALALLDLVLAGPPGALLALDGDTTRDALQRLERAARREAGDGAAYAVREQIAASVHVLVQVVPQPGGGVRVAQISEVMGIDQQGYALRDLPL